MACLLFIFMSSASGASLLHGGAPHRDQAAGLANEWPAAANTPAGDTSSKDAIPVDGAIAKAEARPQARRSAAAKPVVHATYMRPRKRPELAASLAILRPVSRRITYSVETLAMLAPVHGSAEWKCLAEALYFEARGESILGQFAVAEVIANRVNSKRFPDSYCGVINQGTDTRRRHACQFSYNCDGLAETIHEKAAYEQAGKIAEIVMNGYQRRLTGGATNYHATSVYPSWASKYERTTRIGGHVFYRSNRSS